MELVVAPPGDHEYVGLVRFEDAVKEAVVVGQIVLLVTPDDNKPQLVEPVLEEL